MRVIDLVRELPRAETRPVGAEFDVAEHTLSTVRHATIAVQAPSRMIWTLHLPARGIIRAWVAVLPAPGTREASATFRIGISDHRIYEPLAQHLVTTADSAAKGWILVTADVSLYGGRQWSLFHRPDSHPWRVIFNADPGYGTAVALWGAPGIDTDSRAARAWRQRAETRASKSGVRTYLVSASVNKQRRTGGRETVNGTLPQSRESAAVEARTGDVGVRQTRPRATSDSFF